MGGKGWNPFPFGLLTLIVSLKAIFSVDLRTHQLNLKAQHEIIKLHEKVDRLNNLLVKPE